MADVKKWIHDAYAMQLTRRDSSGGDPVSGRNYGMARSVWMGKIMVAVESQKRPYPELLQFLYAPEYTDSQFQVLRRSARGAVLVAERGIHKPPQERVWNKLGDLAEVALFDYQAEQRGGGRFTLKRILLMSGIDESNWHKDERRWRVRYHLMQNALHRWERTALEKPRAVVEEIEEREHVATANA